MPAERGRAPAGWYGDPSGLAVWRWWDGYSWTHYVWPGEFSAGETYAAEQKAAPYGQLAFIGWVLVIAAGLLIAWATSSEYRAFFHAVRVQIDTHSPTTTNRVHVPQIGYLVTLVQVPAYVGMLIWQFRAAKTARNLGWPAKHSPALGTWSWIIPVVNYWFPYQAIRDCLAPGDPNRSLVRRLWACFIGMTVTNWAAVILIYIGLSVGAIVSAIALGFAVGFAVSGAQTVRVIRDAHGLCVPAMPARPAL
jgi:hypothetical protein